MDWFLYDTGLRHERVKRIFTKEKIKRAACDWGIQNEKNALEEYAIKLNLNKTKLENVGLIINSKWPWLDASPDALADGDIVQLFEVKCPSAKRNQAIIIVCDNKKFRLEICSGVPKFKSQDSNFYQCQAIMAITEINELDFVVYTLKEMHISQESGIRKFCQN